MKNLKVVLLAVLTAVGLAGCGECQHVDENHDHKCDKCDVVMSQCEDKDPKDHLCDWCGAKVSEHEAVAGSHNCGICGEKISEHKDENKDHNCDICGEKLSEHHAADGSHNCEYCGAKLSEHQAAEGSHNCAICGAKLSECEAAEGSHYCATCGAKLTEHVDAMHDGACDICGEAMAVVHVDPGHDGTCDVCGAPVAVHHVDDGSGYCSCGKKIVLESAVLNVDAAKKVYGKDQLFDDSGVKVMGTYTDEQVKEVPCTCSKPDMSTVGTKEITVTYLDKDGNEQQFYFNINVSYWTEEDLEIMSVGSIAASAALPLPYLPGMVVDYDAVEEKLISWNILKEGSSLDDLDEYWELMTEYEYVNAKGISFEMVELIVPQGLAEMYDFTDCYAFSCVPISTRGTRAYVYDEFFVFGLTEEGEFKLYNRLVPAFLDGMYAGPYYLADYIFNVAEGMIGEGEDAETVGEFFSYTSMIPFYYFSELAGDYVFLPNLEGNGIIYIDSYNTSYPFDESLDDYEIAAEFNFWGGTEFERGKYTDDLLFMGFALDVERSDEDGDLYTFSDPYIGSIEVFVCNYSETFVTDTQGAEAAEYYGLDAGYAVELYYSAPDRDDYVTRFTEELDNILEAFGEKVENLEIVTDYYDPDTAEGEVIADFYVCAEEGPLDSETVEAELAALIPVGYYSMGAAEYNSQYGCWEEEFTDGFNGLYLSVFDADKDGDCEVYLEIYDGEDVLETYVNKAAMVISMFVGQTVTPSLVVEGEYLMTGEVTNDVVPSTKDLLEQFVEYYSILGLIDENYSEATEVASGKYEIKADSYNKQYVVTFDVTSLGDDRYEISVDVLVAPDFEGDAEDAIKEIAFSLFGNPDAYSVDSGVYSTGANLYSEVPETDVVAALYSALTTAVEYLPKGSVATGNPVFDSETVEYYQNFVSADGEVLYTVCAYISDFDTETSLYSIGFEFYVMNAPVTADKLADGLVAYWGAQDAGWISDSVYNAWAAPFDASYSSYLLNILSLTLNYSEREILDLDTSLYAITGGYMYFVISADYESYAQIQVYVNNGYIFVDVYSFEYVANEKAETALLDALAKAEVSNPKLGKQYFMDMSTGGYKFTANLATVATDTVDETYLKGVLDSFNACCPEGYTFVNYSYDETTNTVKNIFQNADGDTFVVTVSAKAQSADPTQSDITIKLVSFTAEEEPIE